jgi:hypothetical protein
MKSGWSERWVVGLGFVLLLFAAAVGVWELLARQAPGSPLFLGDLPGPIASLKSTAVVLGVVLLAVAAWIPSAYSGGEPRWMVGVLFAGVALSMGAGLVGALEGMYLVQFVNSRSDATVLVAAKCLGHLLLGVCLLDVARRVLFGRRTK